MSERSEVRTTRPVVGWHPLDPVALVAGLLVVALSLAVLLDVDLDGRVVLPALLIGAGVAGAATALRSR